MFTESATVILSLGKTRAIQAASWHVNFTTGVDADYEGLLAENREICKRQMTKKASPDVPPYRAVFSFTVRLHGFPRCPPVAFLLFI